MASWNEIKPDPDTGALNEPASQSKGQDPDQDPNDPLRKPAKPQDYNHDRLDAGDLLDDVTGSFDDEINLPRT